MYEFAEKSAYGDVDPISRTTIEFEDIDGYEAVVSAILQNFYGFRDAHEGGPFAIEVRHYDGTWEIEARPYKAAVALTLDEARLVRLAARRLAELSRSTPGAWDDEAMRGARITDELGERVEHSRLF